MSSIRRFWCVSVIVTACLCAALASAREREVLFSHGMTEPMRAMVAEVRNTATPVVPFDQLQQPGAYFARIAPRKYVLNPDNTLNADAVLSTKPVAFITTPECLYGRSLLDIYADIGYEAEDILRWQRGEDMVAIVFRYDDSVKLDTARSGPLPEDLSQTVIVPTWDNILELFTRMAASALIDSARHGEYAPDRLFFRSEAEREFVVGFPAGGKMRVKSAGYDALKSTGGADWVYRSFMETKLSAFEHFKGNGRTQNELRDPDNRHPDDGLREFVGPNRRLAALPEIAVVHLGKLIVEDSYGGPEGK